MNEIPPDEDKEDLALSVARDCVSSIRLYKLDWQESIIVRDEIAEIFADELRKYINKDYSGTVTA